MTRLLLGLSPKAVKKAGQDDEMLLHAAGESNSMEIVTLLLESNAGIDSTDTQERVPLYYAANEGYVQIVKQLIIYGAAVNHAVSSGHTPLHQAAYQGHDEALQPC
ncbi:ankyrin repeat-containing domain protein [Aspergillus pseudotamarii]|uniref:Ankyrin repeat-containing domain protein n=1 Tax=Aspergillus pseudotamarii TaxID=132259 RepID=A0A5N6SBX4_ASPPS|nr:ankyrin repeat-containing domain protein [Aspergillus pseudotamarii]KAE8132105.1 ankyrin repeat-containing domain protein [Aspergillus pseudotamarii]